MKLRYYQSRAITDIEEVFNDGYRNVLYTLPTGAGKTIIFSELAKRHKGTVLILAHRIELIRQASRSLTKCEVPHGFINAKSYGLKFKVNIGSIISTLNKIHKIQKPSLIIIDESHHSTAESYLKIIEEFPEAKVLGVTATPCRLTGTPLGKDHGGIYEKLVIGSTVSELVNAGYLAESVVYAPPINADIGSINKTLGDFDKKKMNKVINKSSITGDVVKHYKRLCNGKTAVAFCVSIDHAKNVADEFNAAGISARMICGNTREDIRESLIKDLSEGKFKILTSSELIGEGVDIPSLDAVILLRPTQSMTVYYQQVGRVLRPSNFKSKAVIIDHVGNTIRHGFIDEEIRWSLDADAVKDNERVKFSKHCSSCDLVFFGSCDRCPECHSGNVDKFRMPLQKEGELELLSKIKLDALAIKKEENRLATTYEELYGLAIKRKYNNPAKWATEMLRFRS